MSSDNISSTNENPSVILNEQFERRNSNLNADDIIKQLLDSCLPQIFYDANLINKINDNYSNDCNNSNNNNNSGNNNGDNNFLLENFYPDFFDNAIDFFAGQDIIFDDVFQLNHDNVNFDLFNEINANIGGNTACDESSDSIDNSNNNTSISSSSATEIMRVPYIKIEEDENFTNEIFKKREEIKQEQEIKSEEHLSHHVTKREKSIMKKSKNKINLNKNSTKLSNKKKQQPQKINGESFPGASFNDPIKNNDLHKRNDNKSDHDDDDDDNYDIDDDRPEICPINECSKKFRNKTSLRKHIKTHGPKHYICAQCGRSFLENSKLKRHHLVHTGEQPYSCNYCSKKFALSFNLKTHMRIHTGEKPFVCNYHGCSKRFSQSTNLKYHLITHENDKRRRNYRRK